MAIVSENRYIGYEELGLAWLSFASGCTDVLSFLKLGGVFTSAMTGNTALLAIAIGRGQMLVASRCLTALFAFMFGVALATAIYGPVDPEKNARRRLRRLLLIETVFLGGCAAFWSVSGDPVQGSALYTVIVLSAAGMGIQGVVAHRINVSGISTIVFTSVMVRILMSLTGTLARSAGTPASSEGVRAHLWTLAAYGCGAGLAGILVSRYFSGLVWVPMASVLFALGFALRE